MYPDDGVDQASLLRHADTAMYAAKAAGRGTMKWYVRGMPDMAPELESTSLMLRRAIRNGELLIHYQPEISLRDGSLIGVEALSRWQHPSDGLIAAEHFIAGADHGAFGLQFAKWQLREACDECLRLRTLMRRLLSVSVNLSTRQLHQPKLPRLVADVLQASGLEPSALQIEITEDALLSDSQHSSAVLAELRALGVRITLDRFGTGVTSLSGLTAFPVDRIKLARPLVQRLQDPVAGSSATIEAIIAAAYALGIEVAAVGIEAPVQQRFLQARGCLAAQGRLYADAVPASALPAAVQAAQQQYLRTR